MGGWFPIYMPVGWGMPTEPCAPARESPFLAVTVRFRWCSQRREDAHAFAPKRLAVVQIVQDVWISLCRGTRVVLRCARDPSTPHARLVSVIINFKDEYIPEGSDFFHPAI